MEVYLIERETNRVVQTYKDVIRWGIDFVEYDNGGRCKIYCNSETEYFTDEQPMQEVENA